MTTPLRVLVVDDAPAVASLHSAFVRAHAGCELVGTAATGPQAAELIRRLKPDLILLDVFLPVRSGLEVLREIRSDARMRQPEVIAVTAARDVQTVSEARIIGARHYLVKPFAAHELHQRIDDVIRDRANLPPASVALAQEQVDALMRPAVRRRLPKGFSPESLELVISALEQVERASAARVASAIGLSRVSCRRYLEYLVTAGLATRSLDYSTSGRPCAEYRLTSQTAEAG